MAYPERLEQSEQLPYRGEVCNAILQALGNYPDEKGHLYYIHGPSGVGKTSVYKFLQLQFLSKDQAHFFSLSLDITPNSQEFETIRRFYHNLRTQKLKFPRYEIACRYLFGMTGSARYEIKDQMSGVEKLVKFLLSGSMAVTGVAVAHLQPDNYDLDAMWSLLELFLDQVEDSLSQRVKKAIRSHQEERLKEFLVQFGTQSCREVESHLTEYFLEDVNEALDALCQQEPYHLIVCLDAFEKRPRSMGQDWFCQRLLLGLKRTIWFIFGTEAKLPTIQGLSILMDIPLTPFSENQLEEYLKSQGIGNETIRQQMAQLTRGLPAALSIMLPIYQKTGELLQPAYQQGGYQSLFCTYFSCHLPENQRDVLIDLSVFETWDCTILKYLVKENPDGMFQTLIRNTALIEAVTEKKGSYRLIDIVRKTLLSVVEQGDESYRLIWAYKGKFRYYQQQVEAEIQSLKDHQGDGEYEHLAMLVREAFDAALRSYSDQAEFEEHSAWCTKTQQALTPLGLFELKGELVSFYLEQVQSRDDFYYDSEEDTKKRFWLSNMRDLIWAYRNTDQQEKALQLAGQYNTEVLKRYGYDSDYTAFSFYLWGLTFRDVGDYRTAQWLLQESIIAAENHIHPDSSEPVPVIAGNTLGYIQMEFGQFAEAEVQLQAVQEKRINAQGRWNGFGNLAKVQFLWGQSLAHHGDFPGARLHLDLAQEMLSKREQLEVQLSSTPVQKLKRQYWKITWEAAKLLWLADGFLNSKACENLLIDYYQVQEKLEALSRKDAFPILWCVINNIGTLHAWMGDYDSSIPAFNKSLAGKLRFYGKKEEKFLQRVEKPTIVETRKNLQLAQAHQKYPCRLLNPTEFILQF